MTYSSGLCLIHNYFLSLWVYRISIKIFWVFLCYIMLLPMFQHNINRITLLWFIIKRVTIRSILASFQLSVSLFMGLPVLLPFIVKFVNIHGSITWHSVNMVFPVWFKNNYSLYNLHNFFIHLIIQCFLTAIMMKYI